MGDTESDTSAATKSRNETIAGHAHSSTCMRPLIVTLVDDSKHDCITPSERRALDMRPQNKTAFM